MADPWFRPQRYGYGVVPVNSQGWLWVVALFLAIMAIALTPVAVFAATGAPMAPLWIVVWLVAAAVIVIGFVQFAKTRTDGEWRWRWGDEP